MAVIRGRDMRGKTALVTGANSGIGNVPVFNIFHLFFISNPLFISNLLS